MKFSERLNAFFKATGMKKNDLPEKIGVSRGMMFNYLAGRNEPPAAFFQAVKAAFPWVNIEWLITGIGAMEAPTIGEPGGQYQAGYADRRLEILLDNFAHLSEEDKQALERMAFALAQSTLKGKMG